jgi:hypothetical protein
MLWKGFGLGRYTLIGTVLEPIAAPGYRDQFGVVEQSIEDGAGGRHIAKELSPFLDGIGGHQGGAVFVAAHDDLQEDFAALGRQDLEPHVINSCGAPHNSTLVDDKEIGLEVFAQQATFASLGGLEGKLAHQVEHRTVEHQETGLDRFDSDGLSEMAFSHPGGGGHTLLTFRRPG